MLILGISVVPMIILNKTYSKDIVQFCTSNALNLNLTSCNRYNTTNLNVLFNQSEWLYEMSYDQVNKSFLILNELYNSDTSVINYYALEDHFVDFNLLNLFSIILLLVCNLFFIVLTKNFELELDYEEITPSDFTLMISGVDKDFRDIEDLKINSLELVLNLFILEINFSC